MSRSIRWGASKMEHNGIGPDPEHVSVELQPDGSWGWAVTFGGIVITPADAKAHCDSMQQAMHRASFFFAILERAVDTMDVATSSDSSPDPLNKR